MAAQGSETATGFERGRFLPVALDTLCPTTVLDFDLFIRPDSAAPPFLYRESTYPLEQEDLDRLVKQGVETLYIRSAKCIEYQRYLREVVLQNESLTPVQRYTLLKNAHAAVFRSAFHSRNLDRVVHFADEFGRQMMDVICNRDVVLSELFRLMDHDYYTYTHATNVCTYCVALADRLGVYESPDLIGMAVGGLLHDVGKRHVPPALLNKPHPLNSEQRKLVRRHPQAGFEELCLHEDLAWGQLMMVYQHHERLDGRGYPVGVTAEDIHDSARICAVADVFDALTSDRVYRKGVGIDGGLAFLQRGAGSEFDREMVECWVETMRCSG